MHTWARYVLPHRRGTYASRLWLAGFLASVLAVTAFVLPSSEARATAANPTSGGTHWSHALLQGSEEPTTTSLTVSVTPSYPGQSVTFTATVTGDSGRIPHGRVVFKDYGTVIGSGYQFSSSSKATFTTSSLTFGVHKITAMFMGGNISNFEGLIHAISSTSPPLSHRVVDTVWGGDISQPDTAPGTDPVVVGMKFRTAINGTIAGMKFYKNTQDIGTHTGSLWSRTGELLASAVFTNETAEGWQTVAFDPPVAVTANTTYIVSNHTSSGHFSRTLNYFSWARSGKWITALADGTDGGNGVYAYSDTNTFPSSTYQKTNYWVDVFFTPPNSMWDTSEEPGELNHSDAEPVALGTKFRPATDGTITGMRFYRGSRNYGRHIGSLWSSSGQLLASAVFTNETAEGWQTVAFDPPVAVTAGTTYVVSYYKEGRGGAYSKTLDYFTGQYANGPLMAPADGADGGNGLYIYGETNAFPTNTDASANYWVDVLFVPE